jgi:SAM-dependent methyltransferase
MLDYRRLYQYRFRGIDQQAREAVWGEIAPFIYRRLGAPERVLDPAAGLGEFINAVPAAERWAVDRTDHSAALAPEITMVVSDIMDAELPAAHFDAAFVSNFLEHLPSPDAVGALLGRLHGWLKPGGRIAVMGPNIRYCSAQYWDCADHIVALTDVAVEEHLYAAGFEPVERISRFLPYSFRGLLPPSPALTRTYLNTPVAWRLLGKQFLVIARR